MISVRVSDLTLHAASRTAVYLNAKTSGICERLPVIRHARLIASEVAVPSVLQQLLYSSRLLATSSAVTADDLSPVSPQIQRKVHPITNWTNISQLIFCSFAHATVRF